MAGLCNQGCHICCVHFLRPAQTVSNGQIFTVIIKLCHILFIEQRSSPLKLKSPVTSSPSVVCESHQITNSGTLPLSGIVRERNGFVSKPKN